MPLARDVGADDAPGPRPFIGTSTGSLEGLRPRWGWRALELLVMSAFAFAQPLYSLIGSNATFLVAHGIEGAQLAVFAIFLLLVPPLVLFAAGTVVNLVNRRLGELLHVVFLGALLALALVPPLMRSLDARGVVALAALAAVGLAGSIAFSKWKPARRFTHFGAFAPPLFLASFLFLSPASVLLRSGAVETSGVVPSVDAPVVWLVLDQWPLAFLVDEDGELNSKRYPNFARLAEVSTWYPRATTVVPHTSTAVPAALTGTVPPFTQLPVASEHPVNLFTLLGPTHDVRADEYVTQLCPDSLCDDNNRANSASLWRDTAVIATRLLLPSDVADRLVPPISDRWNGFGEESIGELVADEALTNEAIRANRFAEDDDRVRFAEFVESIGSTSRPGLHYLHVFAPHEPLRFLPDGRSYNQNFAIRPDDEGRWPDQPEMMAQRLQQYVAQTMFTDRLVGQLLDRLETTGLLDEVLLVVMSDHGMSTLPGSANRSETDEATLADVLPVPLFIKAPGNSSGDTSLLGAQQIDVLPTVLDMLGIDPTPLQFDGRSLVGDDFDDRKPLLLERSGVRELATRIDVTDSPTIPWISAQLPVAENPFKFGDHSDLVGQPVDRLEIGPSSLFANLAGKSEFEDVRPDSDHVPASVQGTLSGSEGPTALAVAVNGVVAGVGSSYQTDGSQFAVLVDPTYFVVGMNAIQIFEVVDGGMLASIGP